MAGDGVSLLGRAEDMAVIDQWEQEYDEQIQALEGELPPEIHELLMKAWPQFKERVEAVASKIEGDKAHASIIDHEIKRLQAKKKALENSAKRWKDYLNFALTIAKQDSVKGKFYSVTRQSTTPTVIGPEIITPEMARGLREDFLRIIPPQPEAYELDKAAIVKAYRLGDQLPSIITVRENTTAVIR